MGSLCMYVLPEDSMVKEQRYEWESKKDHLPWLPNPPPCNYEDEKTKTTLENLWLKYKSSIEYNLENIVQDDLHNISEPVRSNFHRFMVNLWAYSLAVPKERRPISILKLASESLLDSGPSYPKWLDGYRSYSLGIECNRKYFSSDVPMKYENCSYERLRNRSVGEFFRPNSCFNWDAPELDVSPIVMKCPEVDQDALNTFRLALRDYLKKPKMDFVEFPLWTDCIKENAKKTITTKNDKLVSVENWKSNPSGPASIRGKTLLAHIPREKKEKRAAVVDNAESALRIRWISESILSVIATDKRNAMKHRAGTIQNIMTGFIKKKEMTGGGWRKARLTPTWSYCRDFEKEGLTRPRIINRVILEEMHRRWPRNEAFKYPGFFDQWLLYTREGEMIPTRRGTGLGMFNAGVTLMQIILENVNCKLSDIKPKGSLYLNDDAVAVFEDEDEVKKYAATDRELCYKLGLAFKEKASFICRGHAVFCEQYTSFYNKKINEKTAYWYEEILQGCCKINASHARVHLSSCNIRNIPDQIMQIPLRYWGWVLYRNEWNRPKSAGGWYRSSCQGVDCSYTQRIGESKLVREEQAAHYAYQDTKLQFIPWISNKKTSSLRFKIYPRQISERLKIKEFHTPQQQFRSEMNPYETQRAWIAYEKRLLANFKFWCKIRRKSLTWYNVWKDQCEKNPELDILPPKKVGEEVKPEILFNTKDLDLSHPYRRTALWKEANLYRKSEDNLYVLSADLDNFKIATPKSFGDKSFEAAWNWRARHLPQFSGRKLWNLLTLPNEKLMNQWHQPFHVHQAVDELTDKWCLLLSQDDIPDNKKELLRERDLVYGKSLSRNDWIKLGRLNPRDMHLARTFWKMNDTYRDICYDIVLKYPGLGGFSRPYTKDRLAQLFKRILKWEAYNKQPEIEEATNPNYGDIAWFSPEKLIQVYGDIVNNEIEDNDIAFVESTKIIFESEAYVGKSQDWEDNFGQEVVDYLDAVPEKEEHEEYYSDIDSEFGEEAFMDVESDEGGEFGEDTNW